MDKYTFHVIGNSHLPISKHYQSCAFTIKHYRMCEMLMSLGHTVYTYGAKSNISQPPPCTEFIETHTVQDIARDFGCGDNREEIGYQWEKTNFIHDYSNPRKPVTLKFYDNASREINKRKQDNHFLLCMQGSYHTPIADAVGLFLTCEPGIGYRGAVEKRFKAFESSYIQNFSYASWHPYECINGSYYDRIIPGYADSADISFKEKKGDYYLYLARIIKRKGILTAYLATKAIGAKLIIAGQGGCIDNRGYLRDEYPQEFEIPPDSNWEYIGYQDLEKRKEVMANAIALFSPTEYLECFANSHVEAMLSGTTVITTSFGVYPGTIPDYLDGMHHLNKNKLSEVVGFKCNTLQDFVDAAKLAKQTSPEFIRKYGERFLMDNVKYEYQKWFDDLMNVYESAIDNTQKGWHRILGR